MKNLVQRHNGTMAQGHNGAMAQGLKFSLGNLSYPFTFTPLRLWAVTPLRRSSNLNLC